MFEQLRKNIVRTIMGSTIFLTLLVSILSFAILSSNYYQNYKSSAEETIQQKIRLSTFSFDAAERASEQLSTNKRFLDALEGPPYNVSVVPMLNTLKNSAFGIRAVTVYTVEGLYYSTFNIASVVPFETYQDYPPLESFFTSDAKNTLSIRTAHIAGLYNDVRYDPDFGMITYIEKLENEDGTWIGTLFVDINPAYIYGTYFDYDSHTRFENTSTYIIGEQEEPLKSTQNSDESRSYIEDANTSSLSMSSDFTKLVNRMSLYQDHEVVSVVPLTSFYTTLMKNGVILICLNVLIITSAYFIAKRIEKSITKPLSDLKTKMNTADQLLKKPE